ncbi:unnamed protein product, partial [Closterium sp. NIES-53]
KTLELLLSVLKDVRAKSTLTPNGRRTDRRRLSNKTSSVVETTASSKVDKLSNKGRRSSGRERRVSDNGSQEARDSRTGSMKGVRLRVRQGRERGRRRRRQWDTQRSSGRTQCHLVCAWDRRRTRTTSATTSARRASRRRRAIRRRTTLSKTSSCGDAKEGAGPGEGGRPRTCSRSGTKYGLGRGVPPEPGGTAPGLPAGAPVPVAPPAPAAPAPAPSDVPTSAEPPAPTPPAAPTPVAPAASGPAEPVAPVPPEAPAEPPVGPTPAASAGPPGPAAAAPPGQVVAVVPPAPAARL